MDYLLKSSAILGIFFICYKVFLQRDTFFESNRWFLLLGLLISSCISLIVIPNYIEYTPIDYSQFKVVTTNQINIIIEEDLFDYNKLLTWIYISGLLFFAGKLVLEFLSLKRILATSLIKSSERFKFVETTDHISPFSFFYYIVYNPMQFDENELQHVINHEKAHAVQLHSIDIIFAQLICILLWFNPLAWIYLKAIQQNLEFIADQKAINLSGCEKSYQTVLLKVSVKNHQLAFTNNFYTSLIKKRIIMLHKSKSKQSNKLKLALVLPVLVLFLMSFNTKDIYVELTPEEENVIEQFRESSETIEIIITKNSSDADLENIKNELKTKGITFNYEVVERNSNGEIIAINTTFESDKKSTNYNILEEDGIEPFRFKSSQNSFSVGALNNNIRSFIYKTVDNDSIKIQSTVNSKKFIHIDNENDSNVIIEEIDEPLFIINGNLVDKSKFEDVDSENILSVFILDDEKAKKKFGKEGENGAIIMTKKSSTLIVTEAESDNTIYLNSKNKLLIDTEGNEPLFILNGKIISQKEMNAVNPNEIESIEVFKDEEAQKLYGDKGRNGVVEVISIKSDKDSKSKGKTFVFTSEEDGNQKNPWNIETDVKIISYEYIEDDNNHEITSNKKETIEFVITKDVSDDFLQSQKKNLLKLGIDAKFSKVKRNKSNEITSIKITLDDNNGRTSSSSWKEKGQAIPDIVMGKSNDDKLYIRAIGN